MDRTARIEAAGLAGKIPAEVKIPREKMMEALETLGFDPSVMAHMSIMPDHIVVMTTTREGGISRRDSFTYLVAGS